MDVPTFIWMFLVLKIPIAAAMWLVWWAVRAPEPDTAPVDEDDDGGSKHPRLPRGPRAPRRGPRTGGALSPPSRVRTAAVGRETPAERHPVR